MKLKMKMTINMVMTMTMTMGMAKTHSLDSHKKVFHKKPRTDVMLVCHFITGRVATPQSPMFNRRWSPKTSTILYLSRKNDIKALWQVAMPMVPSESEQRRRSSQQQQQALQGASSSIQGGGQQQPLQGVYAQQGACQQQGVYATSLVQGVSDQQQQSQGAGYPSCQQQEQYSLSPHAQFRNSYMGPGPGPGVWVGGGQHQGPAHGSNAGGRPEFGGGGQQFGGGGQSSTLDRQRRGQQQQIHSSDSMYHTCTRRPQSMKKKVVTIRENNDTESEVWIFEYFGGASIFKKTNVLTKGERID